MLKLKKKICWNRLRSCENAIGVMTKLQTSLVAEETWVDGAAEKLASLPTATSAYELDVSISFVAKLNRHHIEIFLSIEMFYGSKKHKHLLDFRNHFYFLLITSYTFTYLLLLIIHSYTKNLLFDICFVSMNLCVNTILLICPI